MEDLKKAIHSTSHSDEKTYAIIHRHWFDLAIRYVPIFFFLLLTTVAMLFIRELLLSSGSPELIPVFYFFVSLIYLMTWIYGFFIWVDYFLDIWIITSSRVINVEQKGFFRRETSELDYGHVQDVTSELSGILQTLINYGDVAVQTAGTEGRFLFRRIGKPEKIKTLVMHLHRQALSKRVHPTFVPQEDFTQK